MLLPAHSVLDVRCCFNSINNPFFSNRHCISYFEELHVRVSCQLSTINCSSHLLSFELHLMSLCSLLLIHHCAHYHLIDAENERNKKESVKLMALKRTHEQVPYISLTSIDGSIISHDLNSLKFLFSSFATFPPPTLSCFCPPSFLP